MEGRCDAGTKTAQFNCPESVWLFFAFAIYRKSLSLNDFTVKSLCKALRASFAGI